ncbi:MAG: TMEM165/GDT1 family protein [Desulfovibrionaceae bacterium]|jgi:putative Ca2+/H+ antiporter (TMEM165/GDT1 family)|nr:TMEM165/GDT1 family protein [Desulfovibrionaceae bacterium]
MDWRLFATTFGTLFLAELGDKTQLACILMTAKTQKPLTVFLGSALALVLVSLLGVLFASFICRYIPADLVKKLAAVAFVGIGALMFFDKL